MDAQGPQGHGELFFVFFFGGGGGVVRGLGGSGVWGLGV